VSRRLLVEADGGSRGNPGPAGYGALVRDADTGQVLDEAAAAVGVATNNVAEYCGLLAGLRAAAAIDPAAEVEVRMDSKLVVEQMSGRWKVRHEDMRRLAEQARAAFAPGRVRYTWVPRASNSHADRLANEAMDAAAAGRAWQRSAAGGAPAAPAAPVDPSGDLTPQEAWEVLREDEDAVLVDVRTQPEWALVGVPDLSALGRRVATLEWNRWPSGRNPAFLDQLAAVAPQEAPVLFLCRSGVRSAAAADAARAAGWERAHNVLEGFEGDLDADGHRGATGWRARGLPWRQS
jgi:ribonuclease HI/rhodanese-related sulfurtransferase